MLPKKYRSTAPCGQEHCAARGPKSTEIGPSPGHTDLAHTRRESLSRSRTERDPSRHASLSQARPKLGAMPTEVGRSGLCFGFDSSHGGFGAGACLSQASRLCSEGSGFRRASPRDRAPSRSSGGICRIMKHSSTTFASDPGRHCQAARRIRFGWRLDAAPMRPMPSQSCEPGHAKSLQRSWLGVGRTSLSSGCCGEMDPAALSGLCGCSGSERECGGPTSPRRRRGRPTLG